MTPEELAEKVRRVLPSNLGPGDDLTKIDAAYRALSELVARLAASEQALAQAEQERDEATARWGDCDDAFALAAQAAERAEADRDRLAAENENLRRAVNAALCNESEWWVTASEALNPDTPPDPDLAGDYGAEWIDGQPPPGHQDEHPIHTAGRYFACEDPEGQWIADTEAELNAASSTREASTPHKEKD